MNEIIVTPEDTGTPSRGPGSELKKLLAGHEHSGCNCDSRAVQMNVWGAEKCRKNIATIVGWLEEGADEIGVRFPLRGRALKLLVIQAIRKSEQRQGEQEIVHQKSAITVPLVWTYYAAGAVGDELRYSIRSVLANNPGTECIVIGDRPPWYTGRFIKAPRVKRKGFPSFKDCYGKLQTAAKQIPEFVWMMDDVYFLKPLTDHEARVPKYMSQLSQQQIEEWCSGYLNAWKKTKRNAYQLLLKHNRPTYDFAAHLPQPIIAKTFLAMEREHKLLTNYANWECLYFNRYYSAKAERWDKRFQRIRTPGVGVSGKHKILNHTHSCFRGKVEAYLSKRFSEPCELEK